jgi:hypothetical protein
MTATAPFEFSPTRSAAIEQLFTFDAYQPLSIHNAAAQFLSATRPKR